MREALPELEPFVNANLMTHATFQTFLAKSGEVSLSTAIAIPALEQCSLCLKPKGFLSLYCP